MSPKKCLPSWHESQTVLSRFGNRNVEANINELEDFLIDGFLAEMVVELQRIESVKNLRKVELEVG